MTPVNGTMARRKKELMLTRIFAFECDAEELTPVLSI